MSAIKAPKRALEVKISIGADDWPAVGMILDQLARDLYVNKSLGNGLSGGSSCHHTIEVEENPEMTSERYFAELTKYLLQREKSAA